ncbi:MAG: penicillin-binding protein 2 [Candidatus Omnitrophica bacterium]|nr:penicillin-binding protein 2 [Candidatus Omnitrophota bacterium]
MRLLILQRLIAGGLILIWAGLFTLQIPQGGRFQQQAEKNRIRLIHLPAARGAILDRNGVPLAEDRLSFELTIFPQDLKDPGQTWTRLESLVRISAKELSSRYRKGYQGPFAPVPLVRSVPSETAFLLEERRAQLPGVFVRPVPRRTYRDGPALGSVAGYVGLIAPEELTHLQSYGYTFRDFVGKEGLEQEYDSVLRGRDGGLQVEVDNRGRLVRQIGFLVPQRGRAVTTSLDGRVQAFCHHLLKGISGAVVVMNPDTGEILALVSTPSFDPNAFVDPAREREVRASLHGVERPMFNRAVRSAVAPGSIFKPVVAYAALKAGKIRPDTIFVCPGYFELGRGLFHCWREEGHGPQTVTDALEHSCNVFFYQTGHRLGREGIAQAAHLFGLGSPTGIDLPKESKGFVPDHPTSWQEGDTISFAIGQGPLQVTPLQMLVLMSVIAEDGKVPQPHLVTDVEGEKGKSHPQPARLSLEPEPLSVVKIGLERVVNSPTGTGRLAQVSGVHAAGKTGTAQNPRGLPHAWFLGYAPVEHPKVSLVVFLEHGGRGGVSAAMVARDLFAYLKELEYL